MMGILIKKHTGVPALTGIARLSLVLFIVSIALSLVDTIWAVYMNSFIHSASVVGFISAGLTLLSFVSSFLFIPLIEKSNKARMFGFSLILFALTYFLFSINRKFYFFIVLAAIATILSTLRVVSFGIMVRDKSGKNLSRNEGMVYTFMNTAWLIGPLIAGYLSDKYGFNLIFMLSAFFFLTSFFLFRMSNIKDHNIKKKVDHGVLKNFFDFFKDRNRTIAYFISGAISLWWVLVYLFIPIYMIESGLTDLHLGYFLFAAVVPLILSEYKFAKLAGKIGFKKIFKAGFLLISAVSLAAFFAGNIYLTLGLVVLASFGVAMIEPTSEAYFFDILKKKEENRFYAPYNTTIDVYYFIGKILASVILIFLPFKY